MRITRETDYAIRCILYLSELPDKVAMAGEIAEAMKIPKSFLAKILQKLTRAKIVHSFRGVKGGVRLAKKPEDISLLDVINTIEGDVGMNICAVNEKACDQSKECSVHHIWIEIREAVENILKRYNFENLRK
ncbi:MAG: Rrf2 family transcriptional regulator [Nitrospirae bacterium]|nr:Rrf2 family transcriptional regulator [Nitrospirota bacterium]